MKTTRIVILLCGLAMMTANAHAAVRSVKGLWVSASDDRLYWLRLQVPNAAPSTLVEELTGSITSASVGGATETTGEVPVTGQYLVRTGIVILNIGKPGANREYAIGDTRGEGRHMSVRVFKLRPGQDIDFERELFFDPKSEPQRP